MRGKRGFPNTFRYC